MPKRNAGRTAGLYQLTTRPVGEYDTLVLEDLNVAGRTRNRRLACSFSDVGMGKLRGQLDYKTT